METDHDNVEFTGISSELNLKTPVLGKNGVVYNTGVASSVLF